MKIVTQSLYSLSSALFISCASKF